MRLEEAVRREMRSVAVLFYVLFVVAGVAVVTPQWASEICDVGLSEDEIAVAERFGLPTCDKIWGGRGVWEGPGDCADDPEEAC